MSAFTAPSRFAIVGTNAPNGARVGNDASMRPSIAGAAADRFDAPTFAFKLPPFISAAVSVAVAFMPRRSARSSRFS
jgi:hypothetical protein